MHVTHHHHLFAFHVAFYCVMNAELQIDIDSVLFSTSLTSLTRVIFLEKTFNSHMKLDKEKFDHVRYF